MQEPRQIAFEALGWKSNPLLLSKIHFKPPMIERLAKEAGIDPGIFDLLKKYGITSEADLRAFLGDEEEKPAEAEHPPNPKGADTRENTGEEAEDSPDTNPSLAQKDSGNNANGHPCMIKTQPTALTSARVGKMLNPLRENRITGDRTTATAQGIESSFRMSRLTPARTELTPMDWINKTVWTLRKQRSS